MFRLYIHMYFGFVIHIWYTSRVCRLIGASFSCMVTNWLQILPFSLWIYTCCIYYQNPSTPTIYAWSGGMSNRGETTPYTLHIRARRLYIFYICEYICSTICLISGNGLDKQTQETTKKLGWLPNTSG